MLTLPVVQNMRPEIPQLRQWSSALTEIIQQCWAQSPSLRPPFPQLKNFLFTLRTQFGWIGVDELEPGEAEVEQDWIDWIDELDREVKTPRIEPDMPLPELPRKFVRLNASPLSPF